MCSSDLEAPKPAVAIKRSVMPDYIVCLEDGKKLKMLKRHLRTTYGLSPEEYRAKWGLPADYPMVAPGYAEQRSALAKVVDWGVVDTMRARYPEGGIYSFWDYRNGDFHKGRGMRIDYLLVTEPVAEVSAYTAMLAHERIEVEDVATATLRFANGALGVIEATTAAFPGSLKRVEIHGSQGSAVLEEENIKTWHFAKMTKRDEQMLERMADRTKTGGGAADPKAIGHHGHARQFQDTFDAIKRGRAPLIDGAEGRRAVETILAIYQSAATGKPVKLDRKSTRLNSSH